MNTMAAFSFSSSLGYSKSASLSSLNSDASINCVLDCCVEEWISFRGTALASVFPHLHPLTCEIYATYSSRQALRKAYLVSLLFNHRSLRTGLKDQPPQLSFLHNAMLASLALGLKSDSLLTRRVCSLIVTDCNGAICSFDPFVLLSYSETTCFVDVMYSSLIATSIDSYLNLSTRVMHVKTVEKIRIYS